MLKQTALRRNLKRFAQEVRHHGDVTPDYRAKKHSRTINNHVYETMEIPLSISEVEAQLDQILSKHSTSVQESVSLNIFDEAMDYVGMDESHKPYAEQNNEPEPTPVFLFIHF